MNTVITGSSKGIGKSIALKFASEGHNLALCARNISDLEILRTEINKNYTEVRVIIKDIDMSKSADVNRFSDFVYGNFDRIDVLINNAGIFFPGLVTEEEDGVLDKMIRTNLYSAYDLTRLMVPGMIKNRSGHIFTMCSVASKIAYPNGGSYSISKFALLGFTKVLREELKSKGIKVTAIIPGATWSDSWKGADFPYDRLMPSEDIADAIWSAYAMSPNSVVEEIVIRPQLGDL